MLKQIKIIQNFMFIVSVEVITGAQTIRRPTDRVPAQLTMSETFSLDEPPEREVKYLKVRRIVFASALCREKLFIDLN